MIKDMNRKTKDRIQSVFCITCFLILSTQAAVAVNTTEDIESKVDAYIRAYEELVHFSGSVLIAKNGKPIFKKSYGNASYEHNVPNTPHTKFRIGSLTKQFTAMAVMMLEEKKQLDVHDKLSRYIPDYPDGDRIEILHLLTHTSGIPDHTELVDFDRERRVFPHDVAQTIDTFKNKPLEFTPGEKFKYSNSGYILLGYIIEKVAQMPYGEFIEQNILRPLWMNDSGFEKRNEIIEDRASGYCLESDKVIKAEYRDITNAHASGSLYSTVEDLYLWDRALYTERLIGKNALERMFTPFKDHYGYGWGVVDVFNRKMVGHNGETEGFRANISRFIDGEVCIIVLSNMEHAPIGKISIDLAAIVFGEKYSIPEVRQVVTVHPDILRDYAGEYEIKPGFSLTIIEENGRLFCQPTGQDKLEVYPELETVFFLKVVDARISFIRNDNNEVEKLILHQGGKDIPATRVRTDR
jgi:CubicO group peptidase (beta-lactamase class C family)